MWCEHTWNESERDQGGWLARLDSWALKLRLYKLARVWAQDRTLIAEVEYQLKAGRHQLVPIGMRGHAIPGYGRVLNRYRGGVKIDRDPEDWAAEDYRAMVRMTCAAGVEVIFISYPLMFSRFLVPNRAVQRVSDEFGVPLVETADAVERVPRADLLSWGMHPSGLLYREIA